MNVMYQSVYSKSKAVAPASQSMSCNVRVLVSNLLHKSRNYNIFLQPVSRETESHYGQEEMMSHPVLEQSELVLCSSRLWQRAVRLVS